MKVNLIIEFVPKINYKELVFNNLKTEYFSEKQLKDEIYKILDKIPSKILDKFTENGWKLIVTNQRNLEKEFGYDFKIYGCTSYESKEAIVYANKYGLESIPHEIAHFLDSLIDIASSPEWNKIYTSEIDAYKNVHLSYYFTGIENKIETFSDAFLTFILNEDLLKKYAPETYEVINRLCKNIDYII